MMATSNIQTLVKYPPSILLALVTTLAIERTIDGKGEIGLSDEIFHVVHQPSNVVRDQTTCHLQYS